MKISRKYRNHMNETILLNIHSPAIDGHEDYYHQQNQQKISTQLCKSTKCLQINHSKSNQINSNIDLPLLSSSCLSETVSVTQSCLYNSKRNKQRNSLEQQSNGTSSVVSGTGHSGGGLVVQTSSTSSSTDQYRCKISIQRLDRFGWFILRPIIFFLLILSLIFYLFYNWIQSRLFWSFVVILLFSLFMYFFSPIKEESLILLDNFCGFEYERRYLCGSKKSTFINTNCIMINEAITMQRVIFYLVAIPFCLKSFVGMDLFDQDDEDEDDDGTYQSFEYSESLPNGTAASHNHHRRQHQQQHNNGQSSIEPNYRQQQQQHNPPPTPPPLSLYSNNNNNHLHHYQHQMSPNHHQSQPQPQQQTSSTASPSIAEQTKLIPLFTGTLPRLDCLKLIYQQIVEFRKLRKKEELLLSLASSSSSNSLASASISTYSSTSLSTFENGNTSNEDNQPELFEPEQQFDSIQSRPTSIDVVVNKSLRIRKNGFLR